MNSVTTAITADQAVVEALRRIERADPQSPDTLNDHLTAVGLFDPFQRARALRVLRVKLSPGGSHAHLTDERKWAYERERWAKAQGLRKGRPMLEFEPETEATRALVEVAESSAHLPDTAREALGHIRNVLAHRANRKLDETSLTLVSEHVEDLVHDLDVAGRVIQEKEARIEQAERHNEQLRQTNDRLLALMERLTGGGLMNGALAPLGENEGDGTRSRTN